MLFDDFYDFNSFSQSIITPKNIPWRKVCWLHYTKKDLGKFFYKTSFDQEEFMEASLKRHKGRPCSEYRIERAYKGELDISEAKIKDLKKMCADLTIPRAYHGFYESLKSNKTKRDSLPEPDNDEFDEDGFILE